MILVESFRFVLCLSIFSVAQTTDWSYLDPVKLQTKRNSQVQQFAALNIINKYSNKVVVTVNSTLFSDHKDVFTLNTQNGHLYIEASTGVAALWGFNYYLKKYCKSHIGWQVKRIAIPDDLPEVHKRVVANDRFRYYQNVCTFSYSFVWWNVSQWEEHVEWMAMNGINLALAPIDQEAIWAKIYLSLGMSQTEIDQHFTGPAFLSWLRMGNIHGWGGPLLKSWHIRQSKIGKTVIALMYDLGMIPVLPTFNGHVPKAFKRIYPKADFQTVSKWNYFNDSYCCGLFLNPSDDLFSEIGNSFLNEATRIAGKSHIYTADSFNEISVGSMTVDMIQDTSKAIFSSISNVDPRAVWMIQNWMFISDQKSWTDDKAQAFLLSVPTGRMLVLDLQSELHPKYNTFHNYYGQPFIWCMLHNFGGTSGMIGEMSTINTRVYVVRTTVNTTMVGIGLTPEGINQNYIVYDLMLESGWKKRPEPNLNRWVKRYSERRYGCKSVGQAWEILSQSLYNYYSGIEYYHLYPIFTKSPSLTVTSGKVYVWYKGKDLFDAFKIFVNASNDCDSDGFYHDLVDITRQALQYRSQQIYFYLLREYFCLLASLKEYQTSVLEYFDLLDDLEKILASNDDFTMTSWLEGAASIAADAKELPLYEFNARNQITLWGPNGEATDYAAKQWAEMVHYYYKPRWVVFLNAVLEAKQNDLPFDQDTVRMDIKENIEKPFVSIDIKKLPKEDTRRLAKALYMKWYNKPNLPDLPLIPKPKFFA